MRSDRAAGRLFSVFLWSMLLLSLFAAPALMAARGADAEPDAHTADLIRLHQEATSPMAPATAPEQQAQVYSRACQEPGKAAVRGQEQEEAAGRDVGPEDEPMIRPAGTRAKRIRV